MTTHTQGPWFVHEIPSHPKHMMSIRASGTSVCVASGVLDHETEVANAHLIAAAPDLFAALEALLEVAVWDNEFTSEAEFLPVEKAARAAIAKAKGVTP